MRSDLSLDAGPDCAVMDNLIKGNGQKRVYPVIFRPKQGKA